jgi:peptidoglycan/xylan/chitin deacetylase (PgdA/CDA1 family)
MSGLRVLMYHKVAKSDTDFLTVSEEQLKMQLNWLKDQYNFITLNQLTNFIKNNEPLPEKPLLITFDDGYLNNYTIAYPIFKALKIPFSIFLVGDFLGKKLMHDNQEQEFLNITQLNEMQDYATYGYHSEKHVSLMDLDPKFWEAEIQNCINQFRTLSIPIEPVWAYTYGSFPKKDKGQFNTLVEVFKNAGILYAMRIGNRINKLKLKQLYSIQRIDIRGNESFSKFKWKVKFGKLF